MGDLIANYGDGDMDSLLLAMKEKAMQAETGLSFPLNGVRLRMGTIFWKPYDKYLIYLDPSGSPKTVHGHTEDGSEALSLTHVVNIDCVVPWTGKLEDMMISTTGKRAGLLKMVREVANYYENNLLGLSGLNPKVMPTVEIPEGAYRIVDTEITNTFVRVARLEYRATTLVFDRPIST